MSAFDRTAVRAYLKGMTGEATPEWGTCFSTDGTEGPTGIGPVCRDEDHEEADGSVYECCPSPVIEVQSTELAEYLAALLNADREQGEKDTREGESTPHYERDRCMHGTSFNVECGGCDALGQIGGGAA